MANLKFIKEIAQVANEIIISTGGASEEHIVATYIYLREIKFPLEALRFIVSLCTQQVLKTLL